MRNWVFVLLACFVLFGAVWASNGNGLGKDSEKGNEGGTVQAVQTSVNANGNGQVMQERFRENYEEAKQKYAESMAKWKEKRQETKEAQIQKGKDYTSKAISLLQKMLEVADNQVTNAKRLSEQEKEMYRERIRERGEELTEILGNLANVTNGKELIEQAKLVKREWQDARHAARVAVGGIGVGKIDDAIAMGWKAENKTEELISRCSLAGFDVSQANAHLDQFREQLRLAEQEKNMAGSLFGNSTNESDTTLGYGHLQEAHKHMVEAKKIAQELKEDLRQCVMKRGHLTVIGNGWIHAKGNGQAEISGNGTVEANFTSGGKVMVMDRAGDAVISVTGGKEMDNSSANREAKYIKVRAFTDAGSIEVSGSRFTVALSGNGIELYATGNGIAILRGTGTYEAGKEGNSTAAITGTWNTKGAAVRIADKQGDDE